MGCYICGEMKYYLIAGERSGDLHGSNLIQALKKRDSTAEFKGVGGDQMELQGMHLTIPYTQLAFMGFWEVLVNLRSIKKYLDWTKKDLIDYQPDVLILIDYPGFNLKMAEFAHKNGIRVFYYISPKIWAWNTNRAYKIKKWVDRMFTILPFETSFYQQYEVEVDYVGNPVMDAITGYLFDSEFATKYGIVGEKSIAVLPGSRKQEVKAFVPQILDCPWT